MSKWTVGQSVTVAVSSLGRREAKAYEATVSKVGRKWVAVEGGYCGRFDPATGEIDGGIYLSPGRVYASRAEYDEAAALHRLWDELRELTHGWDKRPKHLTSTELRAVLTILKARGDA